MPIAFLAMRDCEIRAARRARSSEMDVGEGTFGAGEVMIGIGGERGALLVGEGDIFFMPFVMEGLRISAGFIEG